MSNQFSSALLPPHGQTTLKAVEDRLNEYVAKMSPGVRITNIDGAFQQRQLWQGVIGVLLQQEASVFLAGWAYFLSVVKEHRKGAFSAQYIHRFSDEVKLTLDERRNLERLLHVAYMTCDPATRTLALKQIDMNQVLARLPSEDMRQKLIAFYSL